MEQETDNHCISGKCLSCYDTKIINKGTEVEEPCPICCPNE